MEKKNKSRVWNAEHNDRYLEQIDYYSLWRLFFISQTAVGRLRDLELSAIGVTPEQSGALMLLAKNKGKSTIAEMADAWLRQRNSVSTLIDRMAKQGLVSKIKIPRQKDLEIQITPKGLEMLARINNTGRVFDMVFSELNEKERQQFAGYLRVILEKACRILDDQKKLPQSQD